MKTMLIATLLIGATTALQAVANDDAQVRQGEYLARAGTPAQPQELTGHNCLTYSYFGRSLWHFTGQQGPLQVPVDGNLSSNDTAVLLEAAINGGGICLQPLYAAAPLLEDGRLVRLLPAWQPQSLGIHAIYASRRQMLPALRTLLDFIAERLAADPRWQVN